MRNLIRQQIYFKVTQYMSIPGKYRIKDKTGHMAFKNKGMQGEIFHVRKTPKEVTILPPVHSGHCTSSTSYMPNDLRSLFITIRYLIGCMI